MMQGSGGFVEGDDKPFLGPGEADETFAGGKRKNLHAAKRRALKGRGAVGKVIVAGVKDRDTNRVSAGVVDATDAATLQGFVRDRVEPGAMVYTDDARAYGGLEGDYPRGRRSGPAGATS